MAVAPKLKGKRPANYWWIKHMLHILWPAVCVWCVDSIRDWYARVCAYCLWTVFCLVYSFQLTYSFWMMCTVYPPEGYQLQIDRINRYWIVRKDYVRESDECTLYIATHIHTHFTSASLLPMHRRKKMKEKERDKERVVLMHSRVRKLFEFASLLHITTVANALKKRRSDAVDFDTSRHCVRIFSINW